MTRAWSWLHQARIALPPLAVCVLLGLAACGSTPSSQQGDSTKVRGISDERAELLRIAERQIGKPYRYGGTTPSGFDCSGLVHYAYRKVGIAVPRTTRAQWRRGRNVVRGRVIPGDLLFFRIKADKELHVGIYAGRGQFIHAPSTGNRVSRSSLKEPYWRDRLIGGKCKCRRISAVICRGPIAIAIWA